MTWGYALNIRLRKSCWKVKRILKIDFAKDILEGTLNLNLTLNLIFNGSNLFAVRIEIHS